MNRAVSHDERMEAPQSDAREFANSGLSDRNFGVLDSRLITDHCVPLRLPFYFAAPSFYPFSPSPASSFVPPFLLRRALLFLLLRRVLCVYLVGRYSTAPPPPSATPLRCVALPLAARPRIDSLLPFSSDPLFPTRLFWDLRGPRTPSAGCTHNTQPKLARIGSGFVF